MSDNLPGYDAYLLTRFYQRVELNDVTGCVEWTRGCGGSRPYGAFRLKGRAYRAHKLAYETVFGTVAEGLELDHTCKNRLCVNVAHLEPVTHAENMRRSKEAIKTHCIRGHLLSGYNIYHTPKNRSRSCRACNNLRNAAYKKRRKAR